MSSLSLRLLALLLALLVTDGASAFQGSRGRGRRDRDRGEVALEVMQERVRAGALDGETFEDYVLSVLAEQARRELPSFMEDPEALYSAEQVAFRREVYAPYLDRPEGMTFLRTLVSEPPEDSRYSASTAAFLLADQPSAENLEALWAGYENSDGSSFLRRSISRQLGRATQSLRDDPAAAEICETVISRLDEEARSDDAARAGAAVEALYRAGEVDRALGLVGSVLEHSKPSDALELLRNCSRLLQLPQVDPSIQERARTLARDVIRANLETPPASSAWLNVSREAQDHRAAVAFLQGARIDADLELLLTCYQDPSSARLLGMDGLQSLRFALQSERRALDERRATQIDEVFLSQLREAGARLFELSELPMNSDEYQAFQEQRNARYNAASYLESLWSRDEDFREKLRSDGDLPEYLDLLSGARRLEIVGNGENVLYHGVEEKIETRLLCATVLARLGHANPATNLYAQFVEVLVAEVRAPAESLQAALALPRQSSPFLIAEIPRKAAPADRFLMNQALDGLRALDFRVESDAEWFRLRLSQPPRETPAGS